MNPFLFNSRMVTNRGKEGSSLIFSNRILLNSVIEIEVAVRIQRTMQEHTLIQQRKKVYFINETEEL